MASDAAQFNAITPGAASQLTVHQPDAPTRNEGMWHCQRWLYTTQPQNAQSSLWLLEDLELWTAS